MTEITRIDTNARMSQAVVHNGLVWLAGQVGEPGTDAADQTRSILNKIENLLERCGSDKSKILQATIWLASMADFAAMNAVWDEWLPEGDAPARACGESRLASDDYKVEIIIVAAT